MTFSTKEIVELSMALLMLITLIGILYRSIFKAKGIGVRIIQFTCIAFFIPSLIILSLEKILTGETIATLMGGITGYVLSSIGNYDNKNESKD